MYKIYLSILFVIFWNIANGNDFKNQKYLFKITASNCQNINEQEKSRRQTGFIVNLETVSSQNPERYKGIVTALHGVCGCKNIEAVNLRTSEDDDTPMKFTDLKVKYISLESDVVVLSSLELEELFDEELNDGFKIKNHLDNASLSEKELKIRGFNSLAFNVIGYKNPRAATNPILTLSDIFLDNPRIRDYFSERNSPSTAKEMLYMTGGASALPGYSGAPIFYNDEIVAVTTGGLKDENTGFGILWSEISLIEERDDIPRYTELKAQALERLFSGGNSYYDNDYLDFSLSIDRENENLGLVINSIQYNKFVLSGKHNLKGSRDQCHNYFLRVFIRQDNLYYAIDSLGTHVCSPNGEKWLYNCKIASSQREFFNEVYEVIICILPKELNSTIGLGRVENGNIELVLNNIQKIFTPLLTITDAKIDQNRKLLNLRYVSTESLSQKNLIPLISKDNVRFLPLPQMVRNSNYSGEIPESFQGENLKLKIISASNKLQRYIEKHLYKGEPLTDRKFAEYGTYVELYDDWILQSFKVSSCNLQIMGALLEVWGETTGKIPTGSSLVGLIRNEKNGYFVHVDTSINYQNGNWHCHPSFEKRGNFKYVLYLIPTSKKSELNVLVNQQFSSEREWMRKLKSEAFSLRSFKLYCDSNSVSIRNNRLRVNGYFEGGLESNNAIAAYAKDTETGKNVYLGEIKIDLKEKEWKFEKLDYPHKGKSELSFYSAPRELLEKEDFHQYSDVENIVNIYVHNPFNLYPQHIFDRDKIYFNQNDNVRGRYEGELLSSESLAFVTRVKSYFNGDRVVRVHNGYEDLFNPRINKPSKEWELEAIPHKFLIGYNTSDGRFERQQVQWLEAEIKICIYDSVNKIIVKELKSINVSRNITIDKIGSAIMPVNNRTKKLTFDICYSGERGDKIWFYVVQYGMDKSKPKRIEDFSHCDKKSELTGNRVFIESIQGECLLKGRGNRMTKLKLYLLSPNESQRVRNEDLPVDRLVDIIDLSSEEL